MGQGLVGLHPAPVVEARPEAAHGGPVVRLGHLQVVLEALLVTLRTAVAEEEAVALEDVLHLSRELRRGARGLPTFVLLGPDLRPQLLLLGPQPRRLLLLLSSLPSFLLHPLPRILLYS